MLKIALVAILSLVTFVGGAAIEDLTGMVAQNLTITGEVLAPRANAIYNLPCSKYPDVCLNWCYFVYCKTRSATPWTVTVDRNINLRPQSDCKSPNRCSHTSPQRGWFNNPNAGWSCDEQPKNTNREGGAPSATRCMLSGENGGEGGFWAGFINRPTARVANGQQIDVKLIFIGTPSGYCAPLANPPTNAGCTPAVESNSPGVTTNGPRQR